MPDTSKYLALGGAAAALFLLASSGRKGEDSSGGGDDGGDGGEDPRASAGFNPQRFVTSTPEMGRLLETPRGAMMLGTCDQSITFRVLLDAAQLADIKDARNFACDTARRVMYANLILACPANAPHLTKDLRDSDFRNAQGYGVDLKRRPLLWLPILDLDMLAYGVVQVAHYEEDNSPCTELPPEIREAIA